jgi:hypothetical protein
MAVGIVTITAASTGTAADATDGAAGLGEPRGGGLSGEGVTTLTPPVPPGTRSRGGDCAEASMAA